MNLSWSNFVTQANKCDRRGGSQGQNASTYIYYKSSLPEVFCKEFVFKNFAKFSGWGLQLYLKETLAQCFPVNFCEVFKNMFLYRTPPETASAISFRQAIFIQHVHKVSEDMLYLLFSIFIYLELNLKPVSFSMFIVHALWMLNAFPFFLFCYCFLKAEVIFNNGDK